jgi:hypothetical protein
MDTTPPGMLQQMHGAVAFFVVLAIAVLWGDTCCTS